MNTQQEDPQKLVVTRLDENFFKGVFYAVTPFSIYEITTGGWWRGIQAIKRDMRTDILGVDDTTDRPAVGEALYGGQFLAITRNGIRKYGGRYFINPSIRTNPVAEPFDRMSERKRGHQSDIVVGLFLDAEAAWKCHRADNKVGFDKRWIDATLVTCRAIGSRHPFICFAQRGDDSVLPFIPFLRAGESV